MMNIKNVRVLPSEWYREHSNIYISSIGYERRARYIAEFYEIRANKNISNAFQHQKVHDYQANYDWYKKNHYEIISLEGVEFEEYLNASLRAEIEEQREKGILVTIDISSMNRLRISSALKSCLSVSTKSPIKIRLVYNIAKYSKPGNEGPVVSSGIIHPMFAGWPSDPNLGTLLIIGLGYEANAALGAVEYLEPIDVIAFSPTGTDVRYENALKKANELFFDSIPESHVIPYDVKFPINTLNIMTSIISGLIEKYRIYILPFGPKIFTCLALVQAVMSFPHVAVWRISSEELGDPINRYPSDRTIGIDIEL